MFSHTQKQKVTQHLIFFNNFNFTTKKLKTLGKNGLLMLGPFDLTVFILSQFLFYQHSTLLLVYFLYFINIRHCFLCIF